MNTIPQLNTWRSLFWLLIVLVIFYWCIKLLLYSLEKFANRNLYNKQLILFFKKVILFFIPMATLILLLDFVSINYIAHSIVLVIIGVFAFSQIKNYVNGLFLKSNPLISNGSTLQIGDYTGEIKSFLPLGLKLVTEQGIQFVNYTTITTSGFAIKSNKTSLLRQVLYLNTEQTPDQILDLLFDNPILNYNHPPVINKADNNQLKLQYTTENGASRKELITFLEDNSVQTNLNNNSK